MKRIYSYRYLIYLLIIALVSTYLILLVYGYQINWKNFKLEKTSVIYIASIPRNVDVYINNRYVSDTTPLKKTEVFPGWYDIKLVKEGYHEWNKSFDVKVDYVSQDSDVILILLDKKEIKLTENEIEKWESKFEDEDFMNNQSAGLYVKNKNELYFKDIYVTRFSEDIKSLTWFIDKKHIIYQTGNAINFMDSDGTNMIKLAELSNNEKAQLLSIDDGKYLLYKQNKELHKIKITDIDSLFTEKYLNRAVKIIK